MTKENTKNISDMNIYQKINEIKKEIRQHDFIMDKVLPSNLGSSEYASIGQYYSLLHEKTLKYNVFFKWDVMEELAFEKNIFQPTGKLPQHLHTVLCTATFVNIDNTEEVVEYMSIASGSDSIDKGVSSGSTLAFRNWFDKNFTPKYLNEGGEDEISEVSEKSIEPKIQTYIPPEKKEELTQEVVAEVQQTESDKDDVKEIIDKIMKVRELTVNADWGASTLQQLISGELSSADILEIGLKVDNKLDSLQGE